GDAFYVITPEGKGERLLSQSDYRTAVFSKDGHILYVLRRNAKQHELLVVQIPDGKIIRTIPINLPSSDQVTDLALHPEGDRFMVAAGRWEYDIYILDAFHMPRRRFWLF